MRGFIKGLIWLVGILAVIAGILRATILDVWTVPDDDPVFNASIVPTLAPGDVVIIKRGGKPRFTDLVRCVSPEKPGRYVIGRVFGEPGDTIFADGNTIKINGTPVRTERACTGPRLRVPDPITGERVELDCSIEEMGGTWYMRAWASKARMSLGRAETEVPEGNFFLVSDNRYHHYDSQDFGPVPIESCTQTILFRLWGKEGWMDAERRMTVVR